MATMTATPAMEAMKERLAPALDTLEENARRARRAMVRGRQATEDLAAGAALGIRRHPLAAVAAAAGAAALAGCMMGFVMGRMARRAPRRADDEAWVHD